LAAGAFAVDLGIAVPPETPPTVPVPGLTVTGEIKSGLQVKTAASGNDKGDTVVNQRNNDADAGFRGRLTLNYAAAWGGAKIRFQSDYGNNVAADSPLWLKAAYGWVNLLDRKIVVYGGAIDDDLWGLGKLPINVFDPQLDAVYTSARIAFNLVPGLSFGAVLPLATVGYNDSLAEADDNSAANKTANATSFNPYGEKTSAPTVGNFFASPIFGALYKSDIFSATAAIRLYSAIDSKEYGGNKNITSEKYATQPGWVDAIAGIAVHPIDPLHIVVDARFDTRKLKGEDYIKWVIKSGARLGAEESNNKVGYVRIGPKVQYAAGPITAHLQGDIIIQNESPDSDGKIDDKVVTAFDYALGGGSVPVPVESLGDNIIAFRVGGDYKITSAINAYLQIGSDNVSWFAGDKDSPGAGLYIKPGIKFTFGTTTIEIFDKVNRLGAADLKAKAATATALAVGERSPVANEIQIDFNWSF
jgi:hypothetical protein